MARNEKREWRIGRNAALVTWSARILSRIFSVGDLHKDVRVSVGMKIQATRSRFLQVCLSLKPCTWNLESEQRWDTFNGSGRPFIFSYIIIWQEKNINQSGSHSLSGAEALFYTHITVVVAVGTHYNQMSFDIPSPIWRENLRPGTSRFQGDVLRLILTPVHPTLRIS